MNSPPTDVDVDIDAERERQEDPVSRANTDVKRRPIVRHLGGWLRAVSVLAALGVATSTILRVLYNVPFDPIGFSSGLLSAVGTAAAVLTGVALVALALATTRSRVRIGFLFVGVFGILATLSDGATIAAVVAIPVGGALAFADALGTPTSYFELRRRLVALAFVFAIGLSLAATSGVLGSKPREVGAVAFLVAVTLLVVRVGDTVALLAGAGGFVGVVAASAAAPYVTGSALLVGFGVVGSPHVFAATAVLGGVAAAVAGLRDGEFELAVGATLLLFAGVPATPAAAMAVCLGAALAVVDRDALLGIEGESGQ